jgi:hypothetical protein
MSGYFRSGDFLLRERPSYRIPEERFVGTKNQVNKVVAKDRSARGSTENSSLVINDRIAHLGRSLTV